MDSVLQTFVEGFINHDAHRAASALTPILDDFSRLSTIYRSSHLSAIKNTCRDGLQPLYDGRYIDKNEYDTWGTVFVAYWSVLEQILKVQDETFRPRRDPETSMVKVYMAWKDLSILISKNLSDGTFSSWLLPVLYTAAKYLPVLGAEADQFTLAPKANGGQANSSFGFDFEEASDKNKYLEESAWQLNRLFSACMSDRRPVDESLKWGSYFMANVLFKTYFKLNSTALTKNIIQTIESATKNGMPPLTRFPKAHQVTYLYYVGLIHFLNEKYKDAEECLSKAWLACSKKATKNRDLILQYLIPCRILTTYTLPSATLLQSSHRLQKIFLPFTICIKRGDLFAFDKLLAETESELCRRHIFLAMDRTREIATRNLFRKVYLLGESDDPASSEQPQEVSNGKEEGLASTKRTRVSIDELVAALRIGLEKSQADLITRDNAECALSNLIYKEKIKGYIAHEAGKVVFSKKDAFPGTGV